MEEIKHAGYEITEASTALVPDELRKKFTDTMDKDIYRALDLLGNPHNIKHPVHYPQVENQPIENENFTWFVAKQSQVLDAITESSTCLPTLKR